MLAGSRWLALPAAHMVHIQTLCKIGSDLQNHIRHISIMSDRQQAPRHSRADHFEQTQPQLQRSACTRNHNCTAVQSCKTRQHPSAVAAPISACLGNTMRGLHHEKQFTQQAQVQSQPQSQNNQHHSWAGLGAGAGLQAQQRERIALPSHCKPQRQRCFRHSSQQLVHSPISPKQPHTLKHGSQYS